MITGDFKCALECKFHKHKQYDEMRKICDAFLGQKRKSLVQHYICCGIECSHETQHIMVRRCESKYKGNKNVQNYARSLLLICKDKKDAIIKLSLYLVEHYRCNYKL